MHYVIVYVNFTASLVVLNLLRNVNRIHSKFFYLLG